jgi:hypothetical protein
MDNLIPVLAALAVIALLYTVKNKSDAKKRKANIRKSLATMGKPKKTAKKAPAAKKAKKK